MKWCISVVCWHDRRLASKHRSSITDAVVFPQDIAAERCSMMFRPPELLTVETHSSIDERTDIWVSHSYE